jgi:hypothetical protein
MCMASRGGASNPAARCLQLFLRSETVRGGTIVSNGSVLSDGWMISHLIILERRFILLINDFILLVNLYKFIDPYLEFYLRKVGVDSSLMNSLNSLIKYF